MKSENLLHFFRIMNKNAYLCNRKVCDMVREKNDFDLSLISAWNEKSMQFLYDKYYRALVGYGCQWVEKELAEDIVQELFSVLWEHHPQFKSIAQLSAYFYTTVHNAAFNHLRHQTVHNNYRQSIVDNLQEAIMIDDASEVFSKEEIYRQLFLAIDQLPPRQREIFLLCMEGKKNKEIAEQLDISAETVKVQKRRAIAQLKGKLSPIVIGFVFALLKRSV